MKKIAVLLMFFNYTILAQDATYRIVYKMNVDSVAIITEQKIASESNKAKRMALKMMQSANDNFKIMETELVCNDSMASYSLVPLVVPDAEMDFFWTYLLLGCNQIDYYYTTNEESVKYQERGGEVFQVIRPYQNSKWTISDDTMTILGHTCYLATMHWEEYDYRRKKGLTHDVAVWFTPDISVPFGPKGYNGLPGLVLRVERGKRFLYATEIQNLKDKKPVRIKKPKKGRKISSDEFNNLMNEASTADN